jgi:DNA-binding NarL/FixJ family response regulator
MAECNIHIAIIEPSHIIFEGLSNILLKTKHFRIFRFDQPDEAADAVRREKLDVVILNPSFILHNKQRLTALKKNFTQTRWIGLVYQLWEMETLRQFDAVVQISDPPKTIINIINKLTEANCHCNGTEISEQLTDRELDVLIQLVSGLSNKEIADKLNISIHTVISHRKNITQKTGIKSQSGLTIFAISNKIISLQDVGL